MTASSGNGWWYDGASFAKYMPLEILMFMYMCAINLGSAPGNELVQQMVCDDYKAQNVTNSTQHDFCNSALVTGKASWWLTNVNFAMVVPSFFVVTTLGALSDKYGRKLFMIVPCIGSLLLQLGILLVIEMDLGVPWLYLGMTLYGVFGTYALFLMALFASIADNSTTKARTVRITVLEGMNLAGTCIGSLLGGILTKKYGFKSLFVVVAVVYILCMVYVVFLPESLKYNMRKKEVTWREANFVSVLIKLFRNWEIVLLSSVFFLLMTVKVGGQINIMYVRHLFGWDPKETGIFLSVTQASQGLSMLVVLPLLVKVFGQKAKDYPLMQVAICVSILQYALWAVFRNEIVMYGISVLGLISAMTGAINRALVSKAVMCHEQGEVFAGLGAVETITGISGPLFFNNVYKDTVHSFPQAFMLVAVGMYGLCFLLMWGYALMRRSRENREAKHWVLTTSSDNPDHIVHQNLAVEREPLLASQ